MSQLGLAAARWRTISKQLPSLEVRADCAPHHAPEENDIRLLHGLYVLGREHLDSLAALHAPECLCELSRALFAGDRRNVGVGQVVEIRTEDLRTLEGSSFFAIAVAIAIAVAVAIAIAVAVAIAAIAIRLGGGVQLCAAAEDARQDGNAHCAASEHGQSVWHVCRYILCVSDPILAGRRSTSAACQLDTSTVSLSSCDQHAVSGY